MRLVFALLCGGLVLTYPVLGQNDRGTITGTVTDQDNAVVPGVTVAAINSGTGAESRTTTTSTGNYTIPSLTAGSYTVTAEVTGFKKFVQENVVIAVATTSRVDIKLQVGATSDTVTVTAESSSLKTETAEQSTIIQTERINDLPLNFGGGGTNIGQVRSPFAFNVLSPGVTGTGTIQAVTNGLPTSTYRIQLEGQDVTSSNEPNFTSSASHAAVDTVEEFSLQTSTFAAEYGLVGGGFYNMTTKSGTNQFHGTGFEYLTNEDLDAYRPYFTPQVTPTNPRSRKNDFGGTFGGPVWIPKVYDGRNKTFFFFGEEIYRNLAYNLGSSFGSLPTAAMRAGDFSANTIFIGNQIGTDPNTGTPILNGAIYDPATRVSYPNGQTSASPFPGNIIPQSRLDPVALKIQSLIPAPTNGNLTNNYAQFFTNYYRNQIPSIKIDQIFRDNSRLSFYFQKQYTEKETGPDGLPYPLSVIRIQGIYGTVPRLNYDKAISPTMLFHAGVGFQRLFNPDHAPDGVLNYDSPGQLGFKGSAASLQGNPLTGTNAAGFPRLVGLSSTFGPTTGNEFYDDTFTAVAAGTWVRGNHTYKLGGEYRLPTWSDLNTRGAQGILNFSANETGDPYNSSNTFGTGSVGNAYASFLLGQVDTASVNSISDLQFRRWDLSLYLQDTWKVTRKLTLDYGLRWDYQTFGHEIHNRWSEFGPNTPNPTVNNIPGATVYEGNGPGRCNCSFTNAYPFAIAPRIGAAYQLNSKTVFRAGVGISYSPVAEIDYITTFSPPVGVGVNQLFFNPPGGNFGLPAVTLSQGLPTTLAALTSASLNPGAFPASPTTIGTTAVYEDPNAGRPSRILQWSIGLQREIARDFVVEANYVGNRGVWEAGVGGAGPDLLEGGLNTPNPAVFSKYGIDPTTPSGQATLASPLGSALGKASGVPLPYPTFPSTSTVLQALRPYPQLSGTVLPLTGNAFGAPSVDGAPIGNSWYDSLQVKATKRYSHGLSIISAFTWSKSEANPAGTTTTSLNNIFNRANQKGITATHIPFIFNTGFSYETQPYGIRERYLKALVAGWTIGGLLQYQSGLPIASPTSSNNQSVWYGQTTLESRVPGQPLFLKNPNCHCINPTTDFVLNPAAWTNPPLGQWGTAAAYYNDFRAQRLPSESMNIGRSFRIRERMSLEVRAEFFNVFNRLQYSAPTATGPQGARTCTNGSIVTGALTCNAGGTSPTGFGAVNYTALAVQPRNGQLVARFRF